MRYMPISEFKKEISRLDISEPITVTKNGVPYFVVVSFEEFNQQYQTLNQIESSIEG